MAPQYEEVPTHGLDQQHQNHANGNGNSKHAFDTDDGQHSPHHRHKLPYHHWQDKEHYRHCKSLCYLVGELYPFLDMPAGVCFVLGSILFIVGPAIAVANPDASVLVIVWPQLVGVIFFTLAKVFAESKAIYAHFYKRPAKRSGPTYHLAIIALLLGGLLFLAAYVLQLRQDEEEKQYETTLQTLNTVGSFSFVCGCSLLIVNSWSQFFPRECCSNSHNLYFASGVFLLIGSCGYVVSSAFALPPADTISARADGWISIWAGVFFLLGSILLLAFSLFEAREMKQGPDPDANCSRPEHEEETNQPDRVKKRIQRRIKAAEANRSQAQA